MKKSACFLIAAISFLAGLATAILGKMIFTGNHNTFRRCKRHCDCSCDWDDDFDFNVDDCEDEDALYGGCDDELSF